MAEAVVSFFLGKLSELLQQEANLVRGVDGEIRLLRDELEWVSSFLKDADGKRKENERVAIWVGQIRDAAFDAEDIIDEYILKIERQRRRNIGFTGFIRRSLGCTNQLITLHDLGNKIEAIKRRVQGISANKSKYGVEDVQLQMGESSTSASGSQLPKEKRLPVAEESEVVGFEEDQKTLVRQLIEGDKRRVTVSIVGMGGLGKTTLARKVYNSNDVLRHFDQCRAWVFVSQEYRPRDLLLALVKCFVLLTKKEMEEDGEEELKKLCDYLKERRYLIVIDDIWRMQAWDSLEAGFPDGTQGSRVMLTTRNENVAWYADKQSPPHKLRLLREDECWELFCKKAFPRKNDGYSCPSDLEKFGKEIVAKCSGLALAVVVLGGLLSRKPETPMAWEKVVKSLRRRLRDDENQISRILALSYNDLPYYLKSCFLYLGVFPEDMEISARKLIQLWVAEGFVKHEESEDETLEDVAEEQLEELIHRSMIQVASKDWRGRVETCRIHDLLRDLSIEEAKEDKFLDVVGNVDAPVRARRLAILLDIGTCNSLNLSTPHIHSLLFFESDHAILKRQLKRVCGCFKLLRVLDIRSSTIEAWTIPEEIGDLIHLRFLAFPRVHSVPSSIYNLYNLQTLRIAWLPAFLKLKSGLWKLQHLRHLDMPWSTCIEPPRAHEPSNNLQTFSAIEVGSWTDEVLMKLTNLRILRIIGGLYKYRNALKFSHHIHLDELSLSGELQKLPQLDEFPPNLTKLELVLSRLSHDQLATLEALPNLQILSLQFDCFTEEKMVFSTGGFCRLLELVLSYMGSLQEWKVEQGAMPNLKRLEIMGCDKLKEVPEGLLHLTSLQELRLDDLPKKLMDRVREVPEGEDWYKIRHIPSIIMIG